ncbi:MAG: hypothetical protein HEQ32_02910 [Vampirovibrio sp.]
MSLPFSVFGSNLVPLLIPIEEIWAYLGETNLFNVFLLSAIVVFIYKRQNMDLGKSLDQSVAKATHDLDQADQLVTLLEAQKNEVSHALAKVESERVKRLKLAEERAETYARELWVNTQSKIRRLTEQQNTQKRLESIHLKRDMLKSLIASLELETVSHLKSNIPAEEQVRLFWQGLEDIEAAYQQNQGPPLVKAGVLP